MEEFTNKNLKEIRKDIQAVLDVAADQLGISLEACNFSYKPGSFSLTVKGIAAESDGTILDQFEKAYNEAKTDDMLDLGDTFFQGGETYTIVGWKPRGQKYNVIATNPAGTRYKFHREVAYKPGKAPKYGF